MLVDAADYQNMQAHKNILNQLSCHIKVLFANEYETGLVASHSLLAAKLMCV
jgi:hypothetical protein